MATTTVHTGDFCDVAQYYNTVLNRDKTTFCTKNDESTPIELVSEIIAKIPHELWMRNDLKILDPCCGNGNFTLPMYDRLTKSPYDRAPKDVLENTIYMTDVNEKRIANVRTIYGRVPSDTDTGIDKIAPSVQQCDFMTTHETLVGKFRDFRFPTQYDLIIANPPYAKIDHDGKRSAKNHNMIRPFVQQCISLLARDGYLVLLIPDNWMSKSDRNDLCLTLTGGAAGGSGVGDIQIIHLDIHTAKRYFKGIGSSFTWFIAKMVSPNNPVGQTMTVSGVWKGRAYLDSQVSCMIRSYIPLLYDSTVQRILEKTVERGSGPMATIGATVSCELHRTTKKTLLSEIQTGIFCHRIVHTPKQILWCSRAHGLQKQVKIFISITDKYSVWVDAGESGMTQAVMYVLCGSVSEAECLCAQLMHPLFVFLNNICRWGKFNNIRVVQSFPRIPMGLVDERGVFDYFGLTDSERVFVLMNL